MQLAQHTISHHPKLNAELFSDKLKFKPNMVILEVGPSPSGHISIPLAKAVHPQEGIVVVMDIEPRVLSAIKGVTQMMGISNLYTHHHAIDMHEAIPAQDNGIDAIIMSNTLSHVADPVSALRECARALSPDGTLHIVDWDPEKDCPYEHLHDNLIGMEDMHEFIEDAGLTHIDNHPVSPYYWAMDFKKLVT